MRVLGLRRHSEVLGSRMHSVRAMSPRKHSVKGF